MVMNIKEMNQTQKILKENKQLEQTVRSQELLIKKLKNEIFKLRTEKELLNKYERV